MRPAKTKTSGKESLLALINIFEISVSISGAEAIFLIINSTLLQFFEQQNIQHPFLSLHLKIYFIPVGDWVKTWYFFLISHPVFNAEEFISCLKIAPVLKPNSLIGSS